MIFAMLYHKTYCNKIKHNGSFCKQFFRDECPSSRPSSPLLQQERGDERSLIDSTDQMDYSIKLSYYYHKRFLIIRRLREGRGHKYGDVSPEDASNVTGRGGEIGIRARLRISWS